MTEGCGPPQTSAILIVVLVGVGMRHGAEHGDEAEGQAGDEQHRRVHKGAQDAEALYLLLDPASSASGDLTAGRKRWAKIARDLTAEPTPRRFPTQIPPHAVASSEGLTPDALIIRPCWSTVDGVSVSGSGIMPSRLVVSGGGQSPQGSHEFGRNRPNSDPAGPISTDVLPKLP